MSIAGVKTAARSILLGLKCRHHILILLALSVLTYFRTIGVPFYFDDFIYIVKNPLIRDLDNYLNEISIPAHILEDTYNNFRLRPLSYLSFSMNYFAHGSSSAGYHVVNIAIHAINAVLVYVLIALIFLLILAGRSVADTSPDAAIFRSAAFFTAALFVVHPVMTNAVTYVTQRMTSLATLFYLASVVLYARHQIRVSSGKVRGCCYALALISCCAAMLTKEIALTLPVMLMAFDLAFCHAAPKQRLLRLAPFVATMGIVPYLAIGLKHSDTVQTGSRLLSAMNLVNFTGISSSDYFVTQLKVVVFYLRLMLVPKGLSLEHHFPLSTSLTAAGVPGALLLHTLLIGCGGYLLCRFRRRSSVPDILKYLAGCGIVWFYLTLSVESSIIPITDPAVEYRLYLPAAGFLLSFVCMVHLACDRYWPPLASGLSVGILMAVVTVFMGLTVARNEVWRDPENFWRQTIRQYPFNGRPYANLADYYLDRKKPEDAIKVYLEAIDCIPDLAILHHELGNIYIASRRYQEAVRELGEAIAIAPDKTESYYSLAKAKCYLGEFDEARQILGEAEAATRCSDLMNDP